MRTTLELRHGEQALPVTLTIDGDRVRGSVGDRPVGGGVLLVEITPG